MSITACVQPAGMEEMLHMEEGERSKDGIAVWTQDVLRTLDERVGTRADHVEWDGFLWEVHKIEEFSITPDLKHRHAICIKEQAT